MAAPSHHECRLSIRIGSTAEKTVNPEHRRDWGPPPIDEHEHEGHGTDGKCQPEGRRQCGRQIRGLAELCQIRPDVAQKSPADARIAAMGHPETERDWDGPQQHEENESGHGVLIERRVREGCDRHESISTPTIAIARPNIAN
jgi:hypothetical protein